MIEFGKTLRLAREGKGISIPQLAEMTHLAPSLIGDLENEEFGQIAAPIYGRGFVKLYCEAVGIDSKPLVAEFMEILNGNRDPHIKERAPTVESPAPHSTETVETEFPAAIDEPPPQPDLFRFKPTQQDVPSPEPMRQPAEPASADARPMLSRYAAPFRAMRSAPPAFWRLGALTIGGLVLLALLFCGVRALYRATSSDATPAPAVPEDTPTVEKAATPAVDTDAAPPAASEPRTPQAIPPLYID